MGISHGVTDQLDAANLKAVVEDNWRLGSYMCLTGSAHNMYLGKQEYAGYKPNNMFSGSHFASSFSCCTNVEAIKYQRMEFG